MAVAGAPEPVAAGRRPALRALVIAMVLGLTAGCTAGVQTGADPADEPSGATSAPQQDQEAAPPDTRATADADLTDAGTAPVEETDLPDDDHSAVRSVVEGFPVELLPLPEDAMILVTSAVPVGSADVQEVSLNLRTRSSATAVMELYRESLTAAGFTEVPPETPHDQLADESTFTRSGGDELVSIGVLDSDGLRSVTIGGRLRTDG